MQTTAFELRPATLTYYGRHEKIQEVVVGGEVIGRVRRGYRSLDEQGRKCLRYSVEYANPFGGFTMRGETFPDAMSIEEAAERVLNEKGLTGKSA